MDNLKHIQFLALVSNRIDKVIVDFFKNQVMHDVISRSKIQSLIKQKRILVNNLPVNSNYVTKINDEISVLLEDDFQSLTTSIIKPNDIKFEVVYEDEDLMVINKPNNLVVHPAPGHWNNTLVNGLLNLSTNWSTLSGQIRPGIVHRIDKQTTGLLVVAKNDTTHQALQTQIQNKTLKRFYLALVVGDIIEDKLLIDAPIGRSAKNRKAMAVTANNSRQAITKVVVKKRFSRYTYIECELETGRTHQIRVHLQYINHPVLGDNIYGQTEFADLDFGQYLHAYKISFVHPVTNREIELEVPLPIQFQTKLLQLEKE